MPRILKPQKASNTGIPMSDDSTTPLPRIELIISKVAEGYTATVWLRTGPEAAELLTDEFLQTQEQAHALAQAFAQQRNILTSSVLVQIKR